MIYSDKVMDHFNHPRNVGIIEDADGVGTVGNPVCGDIMKMYLKIDHALSQMSGSRPLAAVLPSLPLLWQLR